MSAESPLSIAMFADALPVAIWVGRVPGGELVYTNQAFEEILGMGPPDEALRGNYAATYSVHDRDGAPFPEHRMPYERAVAERRTVVIDDLVVHRGDRRIYLRVFARPLFDEAGEINYVVEAFIDISREVEAERARVEGEARLHQAQRLQAVGQLAGGIAHDFNNLLASIQLMASQLRLGEHDESRLETLRYIDQATSSAAELTRALLAFAQRGRHLTQRISLNALVASVGALGRRTVGRGIELDWELEASPGEVVGDVAHLEQVVLNLMINARDAMEGAGQLRLRTYDVPGEPWVVLEVHDTGSGIDPQVRDRIFEPYVTTKTSGTIKGTGLGLATAYGVVHAHGGRLEVASTGPEGTVMRATLPTAPPRQPAERTSVVPSPPPSIPVIGAGPVLVVDDEPVVRTFLAQALRRLGFEVVTAADGAQAIALFRAQPPASFQAIVLDLVMPRLTGHETFQALRAHDPAIPVLLCTGCDLNDEAQRMIDGGAGELLTKPFTPEALSNALARVLTPARP